MLVELVGNDRLPPFIHMHMLDRLLRGWCSLANASSVARKADWALSASDSAENKACITERRTARSHRLAVTAALIAGIIASLNCHGGGGDELDVLSLDVDASQWGAGAAKTGIRARVVPNDEKLRVGPHQRFAQHNFSREMQRIDAHVWISDNSDHFRDVCALIPGDPSTAGELRGYACASFPLKEGNEAHLWKADILWNDVTQQLGCAAQHRLGTVTRVYRAWSLHLLVD